MSKKEVFFKKMLEYLPVTEAKYYSSIEKYGMLLETVVIEDVFMPEINRMLAKNEDTDLLKVIFDYFEEVANTDEEQLLNIFSTTVLEVLGNDRGLLKIAQTYMGAKTTELQIEADKDLGRF